MNSRWRRLPGLVVCLLASIIGLLPQSAVGLDTPNVLMGIDGMVVNAPGLFRNPGSVGGTGPDDGFNTFNFFSLSLFPGKLGRYKSFYMLDTNVNPDDPQNFGGISHNARYHSDTPEVFVSTQFVAVAPLDLHSAYAPLVDRGSFGQVFDPAEYQIEVKYKPNGVAGGGELPIVNEAHTFNVGLDQIDGFVFDAEAGIYKRASEGISYTIGTEAIGLNDYFATAPKDADGFATYTVPLTTPAFVQKSFYHVFGDNPFRDAHVTTGGGRVQNPDLTYTDVTDGLDPLSFGGGQTEPNRPNSQLKVPNGVPFIGIQSAGAGADETRVLSVELRSVLLKRITPNAIMARVDKNSGLSFRFGDGLTYSTAADAATRPPITVPGDAFPYVPNYTNQFSRFDQNGLTNLIINPRSGPDPNTGYRFFVRGAPGAESFDGTQAMVNIRAKLTEPLSNPGVAQNMTVYARDLDGSDTNADTSVGPVIIPADPKGADEFTFSLALNQFNATTFTTISVPLSSFTVSTSPMGGNPVGALFANPGDGLLTNFNLFEFGALVPNGGGLVRLEMEFMELVLPPAGDADFDNNGFVDGTDLLIWQRGVGKAGSATNGDANGDGQVNGLDLTIIRSKLVGPLATTASGAAPEPTGGLLAVIAAVAAFRRQRV